MSPNFSSSNTLENFCSRKRVKQNDDGSKENQFVSNLFLGNIDFYQNLLIFDLFFIFWKNEQSGEGKRAERLSAAVPRCGETEFPF